MMPIGAETSRGAIVAWLMGLAAITLLAVGYVVYTGVHPARGYTTLGFLLGLAASALLLGALLYSARKRIAQERLPGLLRGWLSGHVLASVLALAVALFHAGFKFDGGSGTLLLLVLAINAASGLWGLHRYRTLPEQASSETGNLATVASEKEIDRLHDEIEDLATGRSALFRQRFERSAARVLRQGGRADPRGLEPAEAHALTTLAERLEALRRLERKLARQRQLTSSLRGWLWLHVPSAVLLVPLLVWHVAATLPVVLPRADPPPTAFASPGDCRGCHLSQYHEWIGTMHAIAQRSPVTDIQNRLVLLREQEMLDQGLLREPLVGDLCVRCHAPSGSSGDPRRHEPPDALLGERSEAGQFGVSCAVCHQIAELHACGSEGERAGRSFRPCDAQAGSERPLAYYNTNNLEFRHGLYHGPFGSGDAADPFSVGNAYHRGEYGVHFGSSAGPNAAFCASCHTVAVHDTEQGRLIVTLQNTYNEWLAGGPGINWSAAGVSCLDCHNRDLSPVTAEADRMARDRVPFETRLERMQELIRGQRLPEVDRYAARPVDGFDRPLPPRRRYNHRFVGVDYHLEPDMPYPADHPRAADNPRIQRETVQHVARLLRIAAAVDLPRWPSGRALEIDVMNLAAGHKLPAGFAFAREMWLEIAVSASRSGDDRAADRWMVVIGGDGRGGPLAPNARLDKRQAGLRNFQAVLFDGRGETVLQNETVAVLTGAGARDAGFPDREQYLDPGERRRLTVELPRGVDLARVQRIRVRLRFRNFPQEFLEGLAVRAEQFGRPDLAAQSRRLIGQLRIFEMAEAEIQRPGG